MKICIYDKKWVIHTLWITILIVNCPTHIFAQAYTTLKPQLSESRGCLHTLPKTAIKREQRVLAHSAEREQLGDSKRLNVNSFKPRGGLNGNKSAEKWLPSDSIFANYLRSMGYPIINDNEIELLTNGREKFISLFDEIRKAQSTIHLEYFNFRNDSIAGALFDLMADKVQDGVRVRAMFDAFGNMSNN